MEKKRPWARKKIKKMRKEHEKQSKVKTPAPKNVELVGIGLITVALICACGLSGFNVGWVGIMFANALKYLFGTFAWIAVLIIASAGVHYILKHTGLMNFAGIGLFFVLLAAIYHHFAIPPGKEILPESLVKGGGLFGGTILFIIRKFFGVTGGLIVVCAGALAELLATTAWSLKNGFFKTKDTAEKGIHATCNTIEKTYKRIKEKKEEPVSLTKKEKEKNSFYDQQNDLRFTDGIKPEKKEVKMQEAENLYEEENQAESANFSFEPIEIKVEQKAEKKEKKSRNEKQEITENAVTEEQEMPAFSIEYSNENTSDESITGEEIPEEEVSEVVPVASENSAEPDKTEQQGKPYILPAVKEILSKKIKKKNAKLEQEIANNAQVLANTLKNFKVSATIVNACHGPAVTRYELEPSPGVKVSKITNLADDLALSLAAFSVRIEPIPGKAAIGIEVPNRELEGVQLREVLETEAFDSAKSKLTVGLGMDISGQAIMADLAKMPHLLVAGATGSGKSVCINTIITSILFKAKPDEVKFILIDPKMVELSNYNGIPHLMVPVVTDAKKAASVLNWAVQEMEKRYALFATAGVRDMERYNKLEVPEKMPAVVIIIDELADLMMVAPHDVEDAICRLAQKARAAGLHLVLATQRPSVDVITGIIKANIPSRISFAVSSQIDSRTILDMGGAEKLLGKGDMLFYPVGASKPGRVQGAFVSDDEVTRLLEYIRAQGQEMETNEEIITFTENDVKEKEGKKEKKDKQNEQDELLVDAVKLVLSTGQASSSSIQRRFRIGYTRAARLVDTMEALHIVGPSMGSKPRDILMTVEQAMAVVMKADNDG